MFRIDNTNAAASLPAIPDAGTEKFFREGDPGTGTEATDVEAWWLNMVQEELRALVVGGGITPSKASNVQVLAAVQALIVAQTLAGHTDVTLTSPASGQALVYNGAAWVNGTPASVLDELQKLTLLNTLRDTIADGAPSQLLNAFPDPYAGVTLIDAGASSGYAYDATNDLINNGGTGVGARITGGTPTTPMGVTAGAAADVNDDNPATEIGVQPGALAGTADIKDRIIAKIDLGSVQNVAKLDMIGIKITGGSGFKFQFSSSTDDTTYVQRGVDSAELTGTNQDHEYTGTFSARYIAVSASQQNFGSQTVSLDDLNAYAVSAATDLTVVSETLTPLAVPTTGVFIGLVEAIDTVTYNTDLIVSMSRDDGAVWDALTLEQLATTTISVNGTPTAIDVVYGEVPFTGASETNGLYKWVSANTKAMQLHGAIPYFI